MMPVPSSTSSSRPANRFDRLDALRGVAILWMAGFHFSFDLNHYGLLTPVQHFLSDPFWTLQRTGIVSLFLLCAGLGQAVALEVGQGWRRFWRRWAQVAGCAVLVSAGSAMMFPQSWISFGVLHGIAAMLLITRLAVPALQRATGAAAIPLLFVLGGLAWFAPVWLQHPFFNSRWWNWTGLVTRLPYTEDYVPVLPWLGVMLAGVALGLLLLRHRRGWLAGPVPGALQPLARLGRWSLTFYMLHQPVLIGGLLAWLAFVRV